MIVFHGTTVRRAEQICREGFLPKRPSKRVWFAEYRSYAEGRGRTQARRAHDRSVVLTCDLDLDLLRRSIGPRRVTYRNNVIAIRAALPVSVMRSWPGSPDWGTSPEWLARWINGLLGLKRHQGVSPAHDGVLRLSRWVLNRLQNRPNSLGAREILFNARRWLPEYFDGVEIDPQQVSRRHSSTTVEVVVDYDGIDNTDREEEAVGLVDSDKPRQRVRGLKLLAAIEDPDLAEWAAMFVDDESVDVQIAALRLMCTCEDVDTAAIEPLADSGNKSVRACAVAALAKHGRGDRALWFRRGLTDPEPTVRLETVKYLGRFDPVEDKALYELAMHDPHPHVQLVAERMSRGKGIGRAKW